VAVTNFLLKQLPELRVTCDLQPAAAWWLPWILDSFFERSEAGFDLGFSSQSAAMILWEHRDTVWASLSTAQWKA
jgi:hypothetical protein